MSNLGLTVVPAHVEALETAGEFTNLRMPHLYYPGCGNDESPHHTKLFGDSITYVDRYDKEAIRLHQEVGHSAFVADARVFKPEQTPDFITFLNPTGIDVIRAVEVSRLRAGGFIGYMSWDAARIPDFFQDEDAELALRGIIKNGRVDESVEDYLPLEDDEELMATFPEQYQKLLEELERLGAEAREIKSIGLIETIRRAEEWAEEELAKSGYVIDPLRGFDLEIPTRKSISYDLILAEKK